MSKRSEHIFPLIFLVLGALSLCAVVAFIILAALGLMAYSTALYLAPVPIVCFTLYFFDMAFRRYEKRALAAKASAAKTETSAEAETKTDDSEIK